MLDDRQCVLARLHNRSVVYLHCRTLELDDEVFPLRREEPRSISCAHEIYDALYAFGRLDGVIHNNVAPTRLGQGSPKNVG